MRIGIDARAYGWAGLGRYTRNMLRHLTALPGDDEYVVFVPHGFARDVAAFPRTSVVPVSGSYYSVHEQTVFLHTLLRERLSLMHFLHFNAPLFYRRPSVVTIHDLTRFFFPAQKHEHLFHQWMYEEVFRAAVLHATRVITVSGHTRNDLIRFFPDVADRTSVIFEGIEHDRFRAARANEETAGLAALGIRTPYLLFVGVWMNHKNFRNLLQAFARVREEGYGGSLVITGKGRPHDEDVPGIVANLGLENAVLLPGVVDDRLMPALYAHANAFVFPSLYEGFGLPPLEAMACGTPVIASSVASIPEILGDAAEYVDPLAPDDIARGILRVVNDPEVRHNLIQRGLTRARTFSWERAARETHRVYASVEQSLSHRIRESGIMN